MKPSRQVVLSSGTLTLHIDEACMPLDDLCGIAGRRSRKRGFVFVSKVLGKHYPVRPAVMHGVYERLAEKLIEVKTPAVLVAMAETATGLGHGIYEEWLRASNGRDRLFLHTTRYRLKNPLALRFEEPHSHATRHLLYEPTDAAHAELFRNARSLVLVDDELTTGRTLANLASAYRQLNPRLQTVHIVCLTDWLTAEHRDRMVQRMGTRTMFHNLLSGRYQFVENEAYDPGPIPIVNGNDELKDPYLARNFGRLGLSDPIQVEAEQMLHASPLAGHHRILVLGTGEFAYPPYLLARYLESRGHDVHYQSTTRSPLQCEGALESVIEFVDNYHDDIPNFVYNLAGKRYDRILIGYETRPLPETHRLAELVQGEAVYF